MDMLYNIRIDYPANVEYMMLGTHKVSSQKQALRSKRKTKLPGKARAVEFAGVLIFSGEDFKEVMQWMSEGESSPG